MSRRTLAFLLASLALLATAPAHAQLRGVELYAPRPFGYVIGDTLSLTADILLDAPFTLDPASLPTPRALDYWLDLRDVRLTDKGEREGVRRYTLDLVYQTFYAPLEPRRMALPGLSLAAVGEGRRVAVELPGWSFLMSPLREIVATGPGPAMALRPDIAPAPIPTGETLRRLIVALGIGFLALLALAWQMGWGPFGRRAGRPFARAVRAMPAGLESSGAAYGGALRALHRAFDATAGKGVFTEDLADFFAAHPAFRAVEAEVRRLFEASRRAFFGDDLDGARRDLPPAELVALSRRLRAVERGSA